MPSPSTGYRVAGGLDLVAGQRMAVQFDEVVLAVRFVLLHEGVARRIIQRKTCESHACKPTPWRFLPQKHPSKEQADRPSIDQNARSLGLLLFGPGFVIQRLAALRVHDDAQ